MNDDPPQPVHDRSARAAGLDRRSTGSVVNVHIAGVGHLSLTDLTLSSPLLTRLLDGQAPTADPREALDELHRTCLDFLDSHLKSTASN